MNPINLIFEVVNFSKSDEYRKLDSIFRNWFSNPKTLNFVSPETVYPFQMKDWIKKNYSERTEDVISITASRKNWVIGYGSISISDSTANLFHLIVDNVDKLDKKFNAGNAVAVSGFVENFIDHNQLIIKKINKATVQYYGRYGFDPARIVPSSKLDPKKMWIELETIINSLKNKYLKVLVLNLYNLNKKKIMYHPASILSSIH